MSFGKSKFGGNFVKKEFRKLKDGEQSYRIVPAVNIKDGKCGDNGIWAVHYAVHYGYKNSEDKLRLFQSPLVKNFKNKMIEVPDAALERIESLQAEMKAAKAAGNEELFKKLNTLVGPMGRFNLDKNFYLNAIDAQGNLVVLQLRYKAKQALENEIKRLTASNVDPLSLDDGRYFVFTRTGTGLETSFTVRVLKEKLNVQGIGEVERDVVHKIDAAMQTRILAEGQDLSSIYRKVTSEQVAQIVAGGAKAVDAIFDTKGDATATAPKTAEAPVVTASTANVAPAPAVVTTSAPAPVVTAPVNQPVAAIPQVQTAPVVTPVASTATETANKLNEMTEEEFMKSIGL